MVLNTTIVIWLRSRCLTHENTEDLIQDFETFCCLWRRYLCHICGRREKVGSPEQEMHIYVYRTSVTSSALSKGQGKMLNFMYEKKNLTSFMLSILNRSKPQHLCHMFPSLQFLYFPVPQCLYTRPWNSIRHMVGLSMINLRRLQFQALNCHPGPGGAAVLRSAEETQAFILG